MAYEGPTRDLIRAPKKWGRKVVCVVGNMGFDASTCKYEHRPELTVVENLEGDEGLYASASFP